MKQIKSEAYENNQDIPNNLHKYLSRCPQKTCHLKVSSAAGTLGRNKDKGENETARASTKTAETETLALQFINEKQ